MELNKVIDKKLTQEQKLEFERDDGKFKLLKNIIILPIVTAILGIYLESILIVTISVLFIIAFLVISVYYSSTRKNRVYENVIIPYILEEKFDNVEYVEPDVSVRDEFVKSQIAPDCDKIEFSNCFRLIEDKYFVEICKVVTNKLDVEENDGVVDKKLEQNFSGVFARVKLPNKFDVNFRATKNIKSYGNINVDKSSTEQVKMNNLEFDMNYDVFSMEPVSLKRVLSPGVLARISEINRKIDNVISFSVYDNILYVTLEYDKFLDFKGTDKTYVNEEIATHNLEVLEYINYFIRYFVNMR